MEKCHWRACAIDERLFHYQCAVAAHPGCAADTRSAEPEEGGDGRGQKQQQRGQSTANRYGYRCLDYDPKLVNGKAHD